MKTIKTTLIIPITTLLASYLLLLPLFLLLWQIIIQYQHLHQPKLLHSSTSYSTITLSLQEYQKLTINHQKEIILNGQLYDIISSKQNQSKITLKLYRDKEEQNLLNLLKNILHQKKNNSHSFFFFEITASLPNHPIISLNLLKQIQKHPIPYSFNLSRVFIEKNTPPPKFIL